MLIRIDKTNRYIVGDKITPGSWLESLNTTDKYKILLPFETHLEHLRKLHNPEAVSRLNCVFAFDDKSAENFLYGLGEASKEYDIVHLSHQCANTSIHNYSVISYFFERLKNGENLKELLAEEGLMKKYWTGKFSTPYSSVKGPLDYNAEVLIAGEAEVYLVK